jgi:hypothetical protein
MSFIWDFCACRVLIFFDIFWQSWYSSSFGTSSGFAGVAAGAPAPPAGVAKMLGVVWSRSDCAILSVVALIEDPNALNESPSPEKRDAPDGVCEESPDGAGVFHDITGVRIGVLVAR